MSCWKSELKTKTSGGAAGTAQALAGLCYCAGRSARPDVALKVSYAATKNNGQKGRAGKPDEAFAQVREGSAWGQSNKFDTSSLDSSPPKHTTNMPPSNLSLHRRPTSTARGPGAIPT